MNGTSRAGLRLARGLAGVYSGDPRVLAVMVGGSVARGWADAYSDLEIGVFWDTEPSEEDRRDAVRRMGGEVWKFDPSGGDRASEHIGLSGATVGIALRQAQDERSSRQAQDERSSRRAQDERSSRQAQDERSSRRYGGTAMVSPVHMTVDTAERWIGALIDDLDTDPQKYELAAAVRHGEPLYGHNLLRRWQERVASFPDRLAVKLVQQNLWLGPWFNWNAYVERGDHLATAQHLVWMQQGIVNVLAALNREYLPSMEHKWVGRMLEGLEIKPDDCEARLRATFASGDLGQAVRDLVGLGMEVIDLVEVHLPEVDETSLFEGHPWVDTTWARQRWAEYPAYTLVASMARGDGGEEG